MCVYVCVCVCVCVCECIGWIDFYLYIILIFVAYLVPNQTLSKKG